MNSLDASVQKICLLVSFALLTLTSGNVAYAQHSWEAESVYVTSTGGLAFYHGDLTSINAAKAAFGPSLTHGEVGYLFTPAFSALIGLRAGDYRRAGKPGFAYAKNHWEDGFLESRAPIFTSTWRYSMYVMLEYNFVSGYRFSPYLRLGGHVSQGGKLSGWEGINQTAFGPSAGLGGLIRLTDRVDLVVGGSVSASFPDRAIDGFTDYMLSDSRSFDLLAGVGAGVRVRLTSSFRPVENVQIRAPKSLRPGEQGLFTADMSDRPSSPVKYEWHMGDGTRFSGRTVSHSYASEDTFSVKVTVSNQKTQRTVSETVAVRSPDPESVDVLADSGGSNSSHTDTTASESSPLFSANSSACQETLEKAQALYEQQQFAEARGLLTPCMNSDLPADDRVQSFRLMTLSYLKVGNVEEARGAIIRLLSADPTYSPDPVYDPPNYVALVSIVKQQLGLGDNE